MYLLVEGFEHWAFGLGGLRLTQPDCRCRFCLDACDGGGRVLNKGFYMTHSTAKIVMSGSENSTTLAKMVSLTIYLEFQD